MPQLLALDLLPLVASVLHGWSVRLRAERQAFDGGGGGGAEPVAGSPPGRQAEQGAAQAAEGSAGAAVGEDPEPPLAAPASPAEWDETSVAAAEATEAAALGALALLEALMADPAGEKAVSASGALGRRSLAAWPLLAANARCCLPAAGMLVSAPGKGLKTPCPPALPACSVGEGSAAAPGGRV